MSINDYKDPIVSQWNKYARIVENEPHVVTSGMFALIGLPDIQQRVIINGYVEIGDKDKIESSDEFKVDYTNGYVFMHSSKEGETINVTKYANRGANYYPASRVWTKLNNLGEVTETLDDLTDSISNLENRIDTGNTLKTDLDNNISTGTTLKSDLDANITTGNQLKVDLPPLVSDAGTKKTDLDSSISSANTINNTLSHATTGTIKKATDINTTLNASIDTANTSKSNLDTSVGVANTSKINLDGSVTTANTAKSDLDDSISVGEPLQGELETTIISGAALKDELDSIIDGSDFENVILDLADLKTDQHNHVNKTVLDDLTDVGGYLQYKGADVGKMTGLTWGAFV